MRGTNIYRLNQNGIFEKEVAESVAESYVQIGSGAQAMFYYPSDEADIKSVGIILIHCDQSYVTLNMDPQLAKQGCQILACDSDFGEIENGFKVLNRTMKFLQSLPTVEKVILMGCGGGTTLMIAYQSIAENGAETYKGPEELYATTIQEESIPADGVMLIDVNYGNTVITLLSLDPAIEEEGSRIKLNPEFDIFDTANGYDPEGVRRSEAFKEKCFKAQADRNKRFIQKALERLALTKRGKGSYVDDEPFIIAATSQPKPDNRLLSEDLHPLSHTENAYDLLHDDGTITNERIYCVRIPEIGRCFPSTYHIGANKNMVRSLLSSQAIEATDDFCVKKDDIIKLNWGSCYTSPISNIENIYVPVLTMGFTGSYEYPAAEMIFERTVMEEKTIVFMEGAGHMFTPNHDAEQIHGGFGDTEKIMYNYMGQWLSRFVSR